MTGAVTADRVMKLPEEVQEVEGVGVMGRQRW